MKTVEIQPNKLDLQRIDDFVSAICDSCHIVNHYASISVAIVNAVRISVAAAHSPVTLSFDYCTSGIQFSITSAKPCFSLLTDDVFPMSDPNMESMYIIHHLADEVRLTDAGHTLVLTFAVRGIGFKEAHARQLTYQRHFSPAPVQVSVESC